MKKKCFIIMLFSISLVVAVFASKRMSVNEIISENVEALSSGDDFASMLIPIKWPERLYCTKTNVNHSNYGFHTSPDTNDMWWDMPRCTGDQGTCGRETSQSCWTYYVIPGDYFLYLLSQVYYFLLIP